MTGHTLCTKIFFKDVIRAIKNSAFGPPANNPYPVILSIEMHCSAKFQDRMYEICNEVSGTRREMNGRRGGGDERPDE
eukprot:757916-Hanusia_phi.AAC.2